ncbi:MAG: GGDEF domain-containing protein [Maricaulaceae bacterium]
MKIEPFRLLAARRRAARAVGDAPADPNSNDDRSAQALGLAENDLSPRAKARLIDLLDDIDRMQEESDRLAERVRELEALADTDPLADVMNRRAFMRELSRALAFVLRHGGPISVLYLDLNAFKSINDEHGHRAGDAAIVHAAKVLKENLRETDSIGRLGGDEFAMILMKAGRQNATAKAEFLRAQLNETPLVFEGRKIALDAAIGVHETTPLDTPDSALRSADEAMFAVKNAGAPNEGREQRSEARTSR